MWGLNGSRGTLFAPRGSGSLSMVHTASDVFSSIESAHEYVALLCEALDDAEMTIGLEMQAAAGTDRPRYADALHLADYKLKSLRQHLVTSRRLLNDLRTLRRYLYDERGVSEESGAPS